jgi:hypothetical protein
MPSNPDEVDAKLTPIPLATLGDCELPLSASGYVQFSVHVFNSKEKELVS